MIEAVEAEHDHPLARLADLAGVPLRGSKDPAAEDCGEREGERQEAPPEKG